VDGPLAVRRRVVGQPRLVTRPWPQMSGPTGLHAGQRGRAVAACCATINFGTCRISALMLMRMCGPGRVRIASGGDDNHFAGYASLTDVSKRGRNLVEREGAVDVDPDVPGNA
jgi:hypothetical protein